MLILPFDVGGRITVTRLMWDDYSEKYVPSNAEDAVLIDVRTLAEFNSGHLDGALNLSVDNFVL